MTKDPKIEDLKLKLVANAWFACIEVNSLKPGETVSSTKIFSESKNSEFPLALVFK